ncbi:hypothetical protein GF402_12015 [Candidatus Fermentibacteria bacterium]|nr:hypothetical protein [Candidatus Fermentibacteria bacterium]
MRDRTGRDPTGEERARSRSVMLPWVFSVAVAIVLWLVAVQNRTFTVESRLAVTATGFPDSLAILDKGPTDSVTVRFEGSGAMVLWDQLEGHPISVRFPFRGLDLRGGFPREVRHSFEARDVAFRDDGYDVLVPVGFDPGSYALLLDVQVERYKPVRLVVSGEIPERYMWSTVDPPVVEVSGPASRLVEFDCFSTRPVIAGDQSSTVALDLPDTTLSLEPTEVTVSLKIPVPIVRMSDLGTEPVRQRVHHH